MGNSGKLATYGTQNRKTKQKHNTICIGQHYAQANTHNVNKLTPKIYVIHKINSIFHLHPRFFGGFRVAHLFKFYCVVL
jgi:hypothetical protein